MFCHGRSQYKLEYDVTMYPNILLIEKVLRDSRNQCCVRSGNLTYICEYHQGLTSMATSMSMASQDTRQLTICCVSKLVVNS